MIDWAVVPTARMASELKKYTSIAPMRAADEHLHVGEVDRTARRLASGSPRIRFTLSR